MSQISSLSLLSIFPTNDSLEFRSLSKVICRDFSFVGERVTAAQASKSVPVR